MLRKRKSIDDLHEVMFDFLDMNGKNHVIPRSIGTRSWYSVLDEVAPDILDYGRLDLLTDGLKQIERKKNEQSKKTR